MGTVKRWSMRVILALSAIIVTTSWAQEGQVPAVKPTGIVRVIKIVEGTPVRLACIAPTRFRLNEEGAYTSGIIPPGATASLCFVEPGTFRFAVFLRGKVGYAGEGAGTVPAGTIVVR